MEDIYIELLRYGKENLADGGTLPEALSHLRRLQPESRLVQSEDNFAHTFHRVFQHIGPQIDSRLILSMEGYFNLLEHDELREARKSSRNALRVAIGAISISAILAAVSISLQVPWAWLGRLFN